MKTVIARGGAGIGAFALRDTAIPSPEPDQALVRIRAATLNYRDLIMAHGLLPGLTKQPDYIPLSCAAGEVIAIGGTVTRVAPGERVSPLFAQGWISGPVMSSAMLGGSADGVAREYAAFPAESLCRLPDELGDLEAATLPCAGLTAWSALFGARPLRPGEWILAPGTGGVSIAALQWAKAAGAHVLITSSSDAKLARARALGADLAINYRTTPDWVEAARSMLPGGGVDIVIDVLGTGAVQGEASLLRQDGIIAAIGMLDGTFSWGETEIRGRRVVPIGVGNREQHEAMLHFAARHRIRPVVDAVYDLSRLPDAMRHLESRRFFGKIGISLL